MTEENRTYITHLKAADIPWHRLTTAYGRGTDFPEHFAVLEQMRDLASVKKSLYELTANMEHQSTLWHATPFGMVFLSRILEKALAESSQNPTAHFLAGELLEFFACILQCFHDGDEMEHASPLPCFFDLLKEEYLWSDEYDEEEGMCIRDRMAEESTCSLEKVKTEDGWADEIMAHTVRCKHCGQIFTCVVNTWRGSGHFKKGKG